MSYLVHATVWAGAGNDRVDAASSVLYGEAGNDILTMLDRGKVYGGDGNDTIKIDAGIARGSNGNDLIETSSFGTLVYGDAGNDTIEVNGKAYGGSGRDTFRIDLSGGDRVMDFKPADDSFQFDNAMFFGIGSGSKAHPGKLSADAFHIGTKAADAEDRFVYNKTSGNLFYDQDGAGAGAAELVAHLSKGLKLTYHDFFVI